MPRLEIHHADGNVTYAELSPDKPLMIGSGPNCDVVLSAPDVKRIHCRIVWRETRWRVEVAEGAAGVQVNDRVVKAGTVRAGEVIGIGGCRIYIDDVKQAVPARAEPTPFSSDLFGSGASAGSAAAEAAAEPAPMLDRHGTYPRPTHLGDQRSNLRKTWDSFRAKLRDHFRGELDRPPGEERLISPLVIWLLVGLAFVALLGIVFYNDFRNRTIQAHFDRAQKAMGEENWEGAIELFDSFIVSYPRHDLASNARVQRAFCEVESAASPLAGLQAVRKMLEERSEEKAFPPVVEKLSSVVGRIAQRLAETARDRADVKALQSALEAQELLRRELGGAGFSGDAQAALDKTLEDARASIQKAAERLITLETMDRSIAQRQPASAYQAREQLVQAYGDFAENPDIVDRMNQAAALDRDIVQWDGTGKNAQTVPRDSAIAKTVLLMDRKQAGGEPASDTSVVFALAGGVWTAHDAATGKALWHLVAGSDAHALPLAIPGATEPTVLLADLRRQELIALKSRTGELIWRQELGEDFDCAPLVQRGRIYQPTRQGSLFVLEAATGRVAGRLQFAPQRFTTTPAADASGQHLFLLGEQHVIYVIAATNPPKCEVVYHLGHRPDSVLAAPLRMQRYLVLCENSSVSQCIARVLLLTPEGNLDRELQQLGSRQPINGWVHHVPAVQSNLMFVATDSETVYVFSAGPPEKEEGFTPVTAAVPGTVANPRGQVYSALYTDRDLLAIGTKLRHYEFKREQATLTPRELPLEGAAALPIQLSGLSGQAQAIFLARRVPSSSAVVFTALDTAKLDARLKAAEAARAQIASLEQETRWEVLLGDGLLSLSAAAGAGGDLLALTRSGRVYRVPAATLQAGGVVDQPAARLEINVELSADIEPVVLPDRSIAYTPSGDARQLFIRGAAPDAPTRPVDLPAPLAAPVVPFGDDAILAPAADGRVYWISWKTGKQLGEPFQPSLLADQPIQWRGVGLTETGAIIAGDNQGNVYQVQVRPQPSPHLAARDEAVRLPKPIRSRVAVIRNVICCVDQENTLRTLDAQTLAPIGEWKLPAPASLGPVVVGAHVFVAAGDDVLACVAADGQQAWQLTLGGETLAGKPLVQGDLVYVAMRSGLVRTARLSDGTEVRSLQAGKPLASGPVAAGDLIVLAGEDGSLNVVKTTAAQ